MSLFEQLKRNKQNDAYKIMPGNGKNEVFFQLKKDNSGSYIEMVDASGKNILADYRYYTGVVRSIVRNIQLVQERGDFIIDWENPSGCLYLHEHPYLIPQLLNSHLLITAEKKIIGIGTGMAQLRLEITAVSEKALSTRLALAVNQDIYTEFHFLSEEFVYVRELNQIFESEPAGHSFHSLDYYNLPNLPRADLQKYLSLFFSYLDKVSLKYEGYEVKRYTEPIHSRPALIFEKVDADHSLYLRIGQLLPNTDVNFLEDYELFNFVVINEMEETINVHPIEQLHLGNYISQVEKMLYKHIEKGRKKGENGIIREDALWIIPEQIAADFIYKDIPSLLDKFTLVGSEKLKEYKINVHPPRLNVQFNHGIDFLEGAATLDFGDQKISLWDAINQFNKNKYILLADGSQALVNETYIRKLQRLFKPKKDKVEISFFDLPIVDELIEEKTSREQFTKARNIFEGFNNLNKSKLRLPAIQATLRPYQAQGVKWLKYLYDNNLGGCLADDMGLGKTLQAITMLALVYSKEKNAGSSLLVMPKSLLFNWQNELKKFAPQLSFYTWYGADRNLDEARKAQLILTTYSMLRNDIDTWKEEQFHYAILDESQTAKNLQSQLHKAVMLIRAKHRIALSGTPVENNLSELYSLFRFLNPAMFGSADNFNQNYLLPIQKHDDKDATQELKRKIYPFILRRLKKDVLKDLPDKLEQTLYVEMSPEQARYYEQRRLYYKQAIEQQVAMKGINQAQFFVFQAMNELRQIASIPEAQTGGRIESPKTELLMEQLEDAVANKHKVLVFANYLAAVEHIGEELDKRGIDFVTMTGSTRNRQQLVEKFQTDPDCKVFVLTLKTGGTGLNLTAADMVFLFDPWWNKAAENQAVDRVHRMGQEKKVLSYKMITLGTIEEKILKLQEAKSALFDNIISSDSASLKSLTEEDIEFMLGK